MKTYKLRVKIPSRKGGTFDFLQADCGNSEEDVITMAMCTHGVERSAVTVLGEVPTVAGDPAATAGGGSSWTRGDSFDSGRWHNED